MPTINANEILLTEDIAEILGWSRATVQEKMARGLLPHRRLPGTRRCLTPRADLEAWLDGAELEVIPLAGGGRIVRPREAK